MKKEIEEILFERRSNAESIANNNLKLAFSFPDFEKHYKQEKQLIIQKAKAYILKTDFDNNLLIKEQEIVDNILNKNNMSRNDITPQYICPKCKDSGYVDNMPCDCFKKIRTNLIMKQNNIENLKTFADSKIEIFNNTTVPIFYKKIQKWLKSTTSIFLNILLQGYTGTGKTFLMECMASEFINNGNFVIYKTSYEIIQDCLKFHTDFNNKNVDILNKYFDCDVLFIDDLGSEPFYKNVSQEYLYQILENRAKLRKKTIISTNYDFTTLKDVYGERCFSRMTNKKHTLFCHFTNKDLRL